MLVAVAVVAGFKEQITQKITGFNAHLQLYKVPDEEAGAETDNLINLTPTLKSILDEEDFITTADLELTVPAVLKTDKEFKGIYMKGSDGSGLNSFIASQVVKGKLPDFTTTASEIAISEKTASDLGLNVGDSILTYFLHNDIQARRYRIGAIFSTHFENYDDLIVLGSINELRQLTGTAPGKGVTMRITTDDFDNAAEYASILQQRLTHAYATDEIFVPYRVESTIASNAAYFSWLQLLDTNVVVILSLMTAVACITLIAAMLILIIDKVRLIGILRAMGARRSQVRSIFVFLALRIAIVGLLIGNAFALLLLWIQDEWHLLPLDADGYYIDFVPVKVEWTSVLFLNVAVAAVAFLALLLPSILAGRISPAESMRYQD